MIVRETWFYMHTRQAPKHPISKLFSLKNMRRENCFQSDSASSCQSTFLWK